jgi:hypothetical protein
MPSNHVDRIARLEEEMNNKIGAALIKLEHISEEEFKKYFLEFSDSKNV